MTYIEGQEFVESLTTNAVLLVGALALLRVMVAFLRKALDAGSEGNGHD